MEVEFGLEVRIHKSENVDLEKKLLGGGNVPPKMVSWYDSKYGECVGFEVHYRVPMVEHSTDIRAHNLVGFG